MAPEKQPLLSIVATSRNDDHGHNLLRRTQIYVNCVINQCKRHNVAAELVLVDWNPPTDRPGLGDVLQWPADPSPCQVRVIQVPPELHDRFRHSDQLPLYQMIAKNVGIRRARGRFVLATNIDIVFNDELFAYFAAGQLEEGCLYRIDRHDVESDVPLEKSLDEQLAYCRTHLVRVNALDGAIALTPDGRRMLAPEDIVDESVGVRFGSGWFPPERDERDTLFRWARDGAILTIESPSSATRSLCLDVQPGLSVGQSAFELSVCGPDGAPRACETINNRQMVRVSVPPTKAPTDLRLHVVRHSEIRFDRALMLDVRVNGVSWMGAVANNADVPASLALRRDVVTPDQGITFGAGCYAPEYWDGESYRWIGPDAEIHLAPPPDSPHTLMLDLEPGPAADGQPVWLEVRCDGGETIARGPIYQRQKIWLKLPGIAAEATLRLRVSGPQVRAPQDPRIRSYRVIACKWEQRDTLVEVSHPFGDTRNWFAEPDQVDVADPLSGVWLGRNWGGREMTPDGPVRWVENDAEFTVITRHAGVHELRLDCASGPGASGAPLEVQVRDGDDQVVTRGLVRGRCRMILPLELEADRAQTLRLHIIGGGHKILQDPRILNLLVFRLGWGDVNGASDVAEPGQERQAAEPTYWDDIAPPDAGIGFGRGWYDCETADGGKYRWGGDRAKLIVRSTDRQRHFIGLDIEPGPAVAGQPFELELRDEANQLVDSAVVLQRGVIRLALPLAADQCGVFELRALRRAAASSDAPGALFYRAFEAFWMDADGAAIAPVAPDEPIAPASGDIVDDAEGIHLEHGWSELHQAEGEPYRAIDDHADMAVRMPVDTRRALLLDVEPAQPGTAPLLEIRDEVGTVIRSVAISERQRVSVNLAIETGHLTPLRIVVPTAAFTAGATPALRVYRCTWGGPAAPVLRDGAGAQRAQRVMSPDKLVITHPARLHTFACGDFTLMARQHWFELRGYAEFHLYSWHIDSLMCHCAVNAGLKEVILSEPMRIYHIEHSLGSGWTPAGETRLFTRLAARGIPFLDDEELWGWMLQMRRFQVPLIFNRDDWGLGEHDLPEANPGG